MDNEDRVRDKILKFLYDYNLKKALWIAPARVANELRREGFDRNEVIRNINFLKGEGYVSKKVERGGGVSFEKIIISSKGVQIFEKSKFSRKTFSSITLEGSNNVLVMGDNIGSITQVKGNSIDELNSLIEEVRKSTLTEEEKMNLTGDVETIKSQLVKPNPSKQIIQVSWAAITTAATFSGAHDLLIKIKTLLAAWLG
ncbi:hypothetical protein HYW42_00770 [Candidatus Daviesbacteria bacterium]|nr:hypothetical protein [Candidatus Daviesbacteria bacterium]